MHRFFQGVTVLWASVFLLLAVSLGALLATIPVGVYVPVWAITTIGLIAAGIGVSVWWLRMVIRRLDRLPVRVARWRGNVPGITGALRMARGAVSVRPRGRPARLGPWRARQSRWRGRVAPPLPPSGHTPTNNPEDRRPAHCPVCHPVHVRIADCSGAVGLNGGTRELCKKM